MKIDFSQKIVVRGIAAQFAEGKDATLGDACRLALIAPPAKDERLTVDKMVERGRLALQVAEGSEQDIKPEHVSLIRNSLPNAFPSPELVVTIYDMLDPKTD